MKDIFILTIKIEMGNDAMQNEDDLLEAVGRYVESCKINRGFPREGDIRDLNGNMVGKAVVTE